MTDANEIGLIAPFCMQAVICNRSGGFQTRYTQASTSRQLLINYFYLAHYLHTTCTAQAHARLCITTSFGQHTTFTLRLSSS